MAGLPAASRAFAALTHAEAPDVACRWVRYRAMWMRRPVIVEERSADDRRMGGAGDLPVPQRDQAGLPPAAIVAEVCEVLGPDA